MLTRALMRAAPPAAHMPVASVGDTAEATLSVTEETIDEYAALVGDDNPLHVDADYAAEGLFGGRVAHGALVDGVVSAALAALPGDVVFVSQSVSFTAPVRPGEAVTATAEVTAAVEGDEVAVAVAAETDDGEVVLDGEARVLSLEHEA